MGFSWHWDWTNLAMKNTKVEHHVLQTQGNVILPLRCHFKIVDIYNLVSMCFWGEEDWYKPQWYNAIPYPVEHLWLFHAAFAYIVCVMDLFYFPLFSLSSVINKVVIPIWSVIFVLLLQCPKKKKQNSTLKCIHGNCLGSKTYCQY